MSIVSYKNVNSVMKTLYVLQLTNCKAQMQGKKVIVLSNLKPRNMRGVKSSGMLMAASDSKHENVELLFPPEEATPGERIWFGSE
jgi:tRNA-binding EMAP/Myf-like protein